jgi:hypothetical protein
MSTGTQDSFKIRETYNVSLEYNLANFFEALITITSKF